ncbi:MAG: TetR/AcrR family transcriptional regulator [Bacteroidia bacterium]|nr:TetR/AcrR family transcriptional regulator [Bacteroidia bacterium]
MRAPASAWIEVGYAGFARHGAPGLRVEALARQVGVSKSSFYHHFVDLEVFLDRLLDYHLEQVSVLAQREQAARSIDPELIEILVAHKLDLLFNRQLRFNPAPPKYQHALVAANQRVGDAFVRLWATELGPRLSHAQLESLFELALENFFLRIHEENLTHAWLAAYFRNLHRIALQLSR